jgi:aminomethyltransferase
MAPATDPPLRRTPLYAVHVALGARMVPFAGYDMPVQYPAGIIKEHLHTRAAASLFDVSHMGQIAVRPRSGRLAEAACALEALVPADILGLAQGRQRYALFTNPAGGVLDDLMVGNLGDHLRLVVNASRKAADEAHLREHLTPSCNIDPLSDHALIAVQGPKAEAALAPLAPEITSMRFMEVRALELIGEPCVISRSGYTGEDGFEISIRADKAQALWETLLRDQSVMPAGLGARDSLRLEAGLCLYGSDLDTQTTPVEAALEWAIAKSRRRGGGRAGGFPGAEVILGQIEGGAPRRRIGLKPEGRAPVRGGASLFDTEEAAPPIGAVTSGGFGISLGVPIAMGYVPVNEAVPGRRLFAELRGRREAAQVCALPFVPLRYKRASHLAETQGSSP